MYAEIFIYSFFYSANIFEKLLIISVIVFQCSVSIHKKSATNYCIHEKKKKL